MQETFKQMCDLESKFFQSLHFWKFLAKLLQDLLWFNMPKYRHLKKEKRDTVV